MATAVLTDTVRSLISLEAFALVALSAAVIYGVTRASGSEAFVDRLATHLPQFGLVMYMASNLLVIINFDDPTAIGPWIAMGLLGLLYANLVSIALKFARPDLVSRESPTSQWLYVAGVLVGFVMCFGFTLWSVSQTQ